jgi:hypothetical protein
MKALTGVNPSKYEARFVQRGECHHFGRSDGIPSGERQIFFLSDNWYSLGNVSFSRGLLHLYENLHSSLCLTGVCKALLSLNGSLKVLKRFRLDFSWVGVAL